MKLISHPKVYFFDNGVLNALNRNFVVSDDRKGYLFENYIFTQILNSSYAQDIPVEISFFRTEGGAEVDFILEIENRVIAVEVKNQSTISSKDTSGLTQFKKHFKGKCQLFVCYSGNYEKKIEGIDVLPWQMGLKEIGL